MKKFIFIALLCCLISGSLNATEKQKPLSLTYDVYAGGFKALGARMSLNKDTQAYDIALDAQTQGFIGELFPWKATYNTQGKSGTNGNPIPTVSLTKSTWKNNTKLTELTYDPKGGVLKSTTQDGETTMVNRDIKQSLSGNAVDILTSTLMMMQNAETKHTCAGNYQVFDGKRRYKITLKDAGTDSIPKSKYSTFSGDALKCTIHVEPVAGFKERDKKRGWMAVQTHTAKYNKNPTIWFAQINAQTGYVPVRLEIASDYGSVVAHLSKVSQKK